MYDHFCRVSTRNVLTVVTALLGFPAQWKVNGRWRISIVIVNEAHKCVIDYLLECKHSWEMCLLVENDQSRIVGGFLMTCWCSNSLHDWYKHLYCCCCCRCCSATKSFAGAWDCGVPVKGSAFETCMCVLSQCFFVLVTLINRLDGNSCLCGMKPLDDDFYEANVCLIRLCVEVLLWQNVCRL